MRFLVLAVIWFGPNNEPLKIELPASTEPRCEQNADALESQLRTSFPSATIMVSCFDTGRAY
jgi:hypothetical protein